MRDDLLVVGFDLTTGREVHVAERPAKVWRQLGYGAAATLVCFFCFHGIDAAPGSRVPLVTRGRVGGQVRTHFAHPPGQAPAGGHHPETIWHLSTKHVLAQWARSCPQVAQVHLEQWTPCRQRRADVAVELIDGGRLTLEAQQTYLTDQAWAARHHDYATAGITDVWFWRRQADIPRRILTEGVPAWLIDTGAEVAGTTVETFLGHPHPKSGRWWEEPDQSIYALHHPPCPTDTLLSRLIPLARLGLDRTGARLPAPVRQELASSLHRAVQVAADQQAQQLRRQQRHQPSAPRSRPTPTPWAQERMARPKHEGPHCSVCGNPLDPWLANLGRHIGCGPRWDAPSP
ncbi:competence protein CoiA family protein [Nonomuraea jabiensis]|uniref:competence protein CoiA family protein n=1 Tax=Nonomuraea jabiensis TaxID=882448 RepID=UPI003D70DCC5